MLKKNSFNGGTASSTITTGNSGGTSGDAFTTVGGAPVYTTSQATGDRGPLVARLVPSSDFLEWGSLTLSGRTLYLRAYLYLTATPSLGDYIISAGSASADVVLWIDSSGRLSVRNGGMFTDFAKQTGAVPLNTWCRVEVKFTIGTTSSNGACEIRRYDSAASNTPTQTTTASSIDLGTDIPTWVRWWYGVDQTVLYDDLAVTDVDWLGPAGVSATASPSVVPATGSVGSPAVGVGPEPAALPVTATVPAATASTGSRVTASTAAVVAAVVAPALSTDQSVDASALPAVAVVPAHTVTTGEVEAVAPVSVAAVATVVGPAVAAGASVSAVAVPAASAVAAPSIATDMSVAPTAVPMVSHVWLPTISVPILPGDLITGDYQLEFNSQLFGGDSVYQILSVEGWDSLVDLDVGNTLRPSRHGAWSGRKLAQERMVGAQILLDDQEGTFTASLQRLRRVTAVPDDDSEIELIIRTREETLVCYGAIDARVIPPDTYYAGVAPASLRWRCSDPRRYGLQVQSVVLSNGASSAAVNDGDTLTHPLVRIAGPATNPSIYNATTDRTLAFTISLASDERLDVDTRLGTVRLGSADRMSALAPLSVPVEEWHLQAGTNIVSYSASSGGSNGVELQFRSAYL